ncbi:M14 family zinc carboxypeptidase [Allokutzneria multivorans]|uniref:M14 family zinc carboxypeptidase n=1 Tax=Allokutzneria multivorans TaxID=1142134 RepID=A0ABP7QU84_9PSEU
MFERILRLVDEVPEIDRFLGVDDLLAGINAVAERHGDCASVRRIGTSRLGEALWSLTIEGGPKQAVVFAAVHPNEPVGGQTSLHLARTLAADASLRADLGHTWHIIPCIDPDGTRLNEGWFEPPLTMRRYGRNFYRPAGREQVEWSFPLAYKGVFFDAVIPETVALMRLFDETEPDFMCSLHNAEYGGVYYYVDSTTPELSRALSAIPEHLGLPLQTGENEEPYMREFSPGVYLGLSARQHIDYLESIGVDHSDFDAGESSMSYVRRYGTRYLISEVPYWTNEDSRDMTPLEVSYAVVLRERAKELTEADRVLSGLMSSVRNDLSVSSPYRRALDAFLPGLAKQSRIASAAADGSAAERLAVVAERFHSEELLQSVRMRLGGMLLSTVEGELAIGNGTPAIRAAHAELTGVFEHWADLAEAAVPATAIPIRKLVATQFGAILASVSTPR